MLGLMRVVESRKVSRSLEKRCETTAVAIERYRHKTSSIREVILS